MLASENDALEGGKIGGVGDVVRDLPRTLAHMGWRVTIVIPSYGFLHKKNPSKLHTAVRFPFAGKVMDGELWEATAKEPDSRITHFVFEHPDLRGDPIYFNDPPAHAFAKDATKYALFCSAIGQYLLRQESPFVLHLHDWHTGILFLLRELHPEFAGLKRAKTVFTIHNVAIQGTRPMRGRHASVEQWFPELFRENSWIAAWKDPRYKEESFTPMAAGIQYADRVNTVSPTYAEEILKPSDHANGFYGGEGLEPLLHRVNSERRLFGILNGSSYPANRVIPRMAFPELCDLIISDVLKHRSKTNASFLDTVIERTEKLKHSPIQLMLTCITRVVDQKVRLLVEKGSDGTRALDEILKIARASNGLVLLLGTGTPDVEELLKKCFSENERFLFVNCYSELISRALYANGTLFLMPSSFEPCGISQMIAMRDGQPCIVNAVGGLKDTVIDGVNGFQFSGATLKEQVDNFIAVTRKAINLRVNNPGKFDKIRSAASAARFTWESSARQYVDLVYNG